MNKIEKFIHSNYEELIEDCFGQWIGFWYGDENFTFEETKELFFLTLKKLLDDDLVVLSPPTKLNNPPVKFLDSYPKKHKKHGKYKLDVWDIPHEEIIQYMRDVFPKVSNENDDLLHAFWFSEECPQIDWIYQDYMEEYFNALSD